MSKKILLLDDDEAILEMLITILTDEGYEVKGFSFIEDIFDLIKQHQPDIIITDYIMNQLNGGEICTSLKKEVSTRQIPVIMMAGYEKVLKSLGDYGCDYFFPKPLDIPALLHQLKFMDKKYVNDKNVGL